MYQAHFSLAAEPFSIAPDPAFLFLSEAHNEALAHLMYGFSHGGFVLITGEVGTGKTTLLRNLLDRTPPDLDVAFILNPRLTVRELLETLCDELGVHFGDKPLDSVKAYIDALNKHLLQTHQAGRSTVMIIDEAQNLSPAVLEQVRLLTNLETNDKKLLRIILVGQPELAEMLDRTELRQLAQRVTARYHLTTLSKEDVHAYVCHRLARAGGNPAIFSTAALNTLYRLSKGTPRLINVIADRAMLGAYVEGVYQITPRLVKRGAAEVFGQPTQNRWRYALGGVLVLVVLSIALAWIYLKPDKDPLTVVTDETIPAASTTQENTTSRSLNLPEQIQHRVLEGQQSINPTTPSGETAHAQQPTENPTRSIESAATSQANLPPHTTVQPAAAFTAVVPMTTLTRPAGGTFANQRRAYQAIFAAWGADYPAESAQIPCDYAPSVGLQCLSKNGSWREISALNSPVVLELWDDEDAPYYASLLHAQDDKYDIQLGDQLVTVTPKTLRDSWFGRYVVLWQTPPDYSGSLRQGDRHPSVAWLHERLLELMPNQPLGSAKPSFDAQLHTAVVAFQTQEGLLADGVVGPMTWIRLSDRLNLPAPKLDN